MGVYPPANALSIDRSGQTAALSPSAEAGCETGPSEPILDVTFEEYVAAIACVREFIAAGDTYQANYTVRARFDLRQNPLAYFLERSLSHPVPYAAYLDLGPVQVISLSPELFLRRRGDVLESRPMKGTRPRGATVATDIDLAYELIGSEKDRAEDLMIVDMVRNDLGRVSRPGTVTVPALFTVEPYGTVWQMSSTVIGRLLPGAGVATIMAATFPGASITGAPKHHTMEIIRDLEAEPRGVYTGFVGLFLPGGDFTCNLCIRTLIHREGRCLLGVGSGVVWDSDAAEEYEETLTKAAFAFPARQKPGATSHAGRRRSRKRGSGCSRPCCWRQRTEIGLPGSPPDPQSAYEPLARYHFLAEHMERLASSAAVFGLPVDREAVSAQLTALAADNPGPLVVRIVLDASGKVALTTRPVPAVPDGPIGLVLSPFRTDPDDRLLRHKTTLRPLYDRERRRALDNGFAEVLFLNRLDRVTEGSITNVCARFDDRWVTPPLSDGLLPGIWRAQFMAEWACEERSLTLDDLSAADEVLVGNSVRGTMQVGSLQLDCLTGLFR